jgi:hypothetical protein
MGCTAFWYKNRGKETEGRLLQKEATRGTGGYCIGIRDKSIKGKRLESMPLNYSESILYFFEVKLGFS